jgi:hypothetical protein
LKHLGIDRKLILKKSYEERLGGCGMAVAGPRRTAFYKEIFEAGKLLTG